MEGSWLCDAHEHAESRPGLQVDISSVAHDATTPAAMAGLVFAPAAPATCASSWQQGKTPGYPQTQQGSLV